MAPQLNNLSHNHDSEVNTTNPLAVLGTMASEALSSTRLSPTPTPASSSPGVSSLFHLPSTLTAPSNTPLSLAPQFLAGVIPLADLPTLATRTLLTGNTTFLDALILCPGIHKQQAADVLAGSMELPATAAMTTSYVFRTENQATVKFLSQVGTAGALTNIRVESPDRKWKDESLMWHLKNVHIHWTENAWCVFYLLCPLVTIVGSVFCILIQDYWACIVLSLLILARTINIYVFRCRAVEGWHGVSEPGVYGDLLVLMSQDRWFRLRGLVNDLKAVTAGSWLRKMTSIESAATAAATGMVYLAGAAAVCSSLMGSVIVSGILMGETGLLSVANGSVKGMKMHGRRLLVEEGGTKLYRRRLDMVKELVEEHGGDDRWAVAMGMVVPERERVHKAEM